MSFLVSPAQGWDSEVSCPRTLPHKNPKDPLWSEPRTPRLQDTKFYFNPLPYMQILGSSNLAANKDMMPKN